MGGIAQVFAQTVQETCNWFNQVDQWYNLIKCTFILSHVTLLKEILKQRSLHLECHNTAKGFLLGIYFPPSLFDQQMLKPSSQRQKEFLCSPRPLSQNFPFSAPLLVPILNHSQSLILAVLQEALKINVFLMACSSKEQPDHIGFAQALDHR